MSTHPNVILKCTIKPDGTTRKLARELLAQNREEVPDDKLPLWRNSKGEVEFNIRNEELRIGRGDDQLAIGDDCYQVLVIESKYDEGRQILGEEGDLVIFKLVTYGYGEEISCEDLWRRVEELRDWCGRHGLDCRLSVSANYW